MAGGNVNDLSYPGQRVATSDTSQLNAVQFIVQMMLGRMATATVVQIVAVSSDDEVAPSGTVDILPLVNQIDALGVATPHAVIYGVPYFRLQGGGNAVICDPVVGDKGIALFASRDISAVKSTKAQANPGSRRRFDYADALYVGGLLNGTPLQYFRFKNGGQGYDIVDGFGNTISTDASGVTINGVLIPLGGISFDLKTHTHDQPNDSHGDTEQPTLAPNDGS